MSDKKQFLILVCVFGLIAIIVGWVYISKDDTVDNVTKFTIDNGKVVRYNANESVVELPYLYRLDKNGNAVFGYDYKVTSLGADAFAKYNKIERLAISINISQIEDKAFSNLNGLEVLVLRGSVPPQISVAEIQGLEKLKEIYVYKNSLQSYLDDEVWSTFSSIIKTI